MPSRNVQARPIKWRIAQDKRVNDLGDPWAMLAYTWMIPSADNKGRMEGDPELLASMIFPRQREAVTPSRMADMLQAMHAAGLVFHYEIDGEWFVQFPCESWSVHQRLVGNMKDESDFPAPPAEAYLSWYGQARSRNSGSMNQYIPGEHQCEPVVNEGKGIRREDEGKRELPLPPQNVSDGQISATTISSNRSLPAIPSTPRMVAEAWDKAAGMTLTTVADLEEFSSWLSQVPVDYILPWIAAKIASIRERRAKILRARIYTSDLLQDYRLSREPPQARNRTGAGPPNSEAVMRILLAGEPPP